jgi:hypothetical protein
LDHEISTEQNNSLLTELLGLTADFSLHARSFLSPPSAKETSYYSEHTSAKLSHEQPKKETPA